MMFASFLAESDGGMIALRINPAYVTSLLAIDPNRTRITVSGGPDYIVADPLEVVMQRLQEAYGPIPL